MSYQPLVGGKKTLRASTTALATSFDSSPISWRISDFNQVTLLCTVASFATATSVDIQVDFAVPDDTPGIVRDPSPVAADWYTRTYTDTSAATASTVTMSVPTRNMQWSFVGNGAYEIPIPVMAKWMQVRAKTTGGPGTTTLQIIGVAGMA